MSKAVLYDATLCIGCLECEAACAEQNQLPWDEEVMEEKRASDHKFTVVQESADGDYMRHLCMHCLDPACVSVCPVAALQKTAAGPVIYVESRCMGCRYCMVACPFGVPKYEWSKLLPGVRKCTMCSDRLAQGLPTACSEACPTEATITGERGELIAEAHRRLRENPDAYHGGLFGEKEVGGTSVLLLSSTSLDTFGFKLDYVNQPLPLTTYRVLSQIPDITTLGFVLLGGIWWITKRREDVALDELRRKTAAQNAKRLPTSGDDENVRGDES
jgi:formate dehydrogenase iron-sulfur subunit